ncbi:MAG: DUF2065 family protein [Oceanicaulis sp.]|uniref:DUF2065 family protein n=1 Tax=Glycocaulis sp. TaxID=1969725 RepID=UPI0025C3DDEC|nr:DUF2065 family protein [Glycocaulis sp.]MCC5981957.1 DUF2065 family protein [Oceanicaulis sp.]MCH8521202.1 DUF2065 family protein [Glycocaulis sp.]
MLEWLIVGLGVALVLEGLAYALAPSGMKKLAAMAASAPASQLRIAGLVAVAVGVFVVALMHGGA